MITSNFNGKTVSRLGFGAMRLPTASDGKIDKQQLQHMVDYAMEHGVNYFDTAWPYHNGESERALGEALARHDRESFLLADKFPGHQIASSYDPAAVFEQQLRRCRVDYFDTYLLHNVYEKSISTYLDPRWDIMNYFEAKRREGKIKHLGFSTHGDLDTIKAFLARCDELGIKMEFCQIQLNYLDWTLQNAREKYEFLYKAGIPVIVMEPVRGGSLAKLTPENENRLRKMRPDASIASWSFRFLQDLPGVMTILSGMTTFEQVSDNVNTFENVRPLGENETRTLFEIAETMKNSVPCTTCRYCVAGCPVGLDIPRLLGIYNELRVEPTTNIAMRIEWLPPEKQPSACLSCGKCSRICPQKIDIPAELKGLCATLAEIPTWAEVCRKREEAQRR